MRKQKTTVCRHYLRREQYYFWRLYPRGNVLDDFRPNTGVGCSLVDAINKYREAAHFGVVGNVHDSWVVSSSWVSGRRVHSMHHGAHSAPYLRRHHYS